ncbi:MAG: single-stranded DNA-binding protein [Acidaminococcus sp.]|uniref:single-stranded DNA-binding protein n=1 Tax=Acidaminococcus sp. TaxID=1872103 RepID=UPI002A75FD35|nr:single-stranded DNA-binding protein [Acidaminococcus sp.]MDY2738930.1 single-stranded DNA-binding protein [Acidaminococcus sp.]
MNKIILLGRLTKDPEIRKTPTDKSVCTFTLAVDRPFSGRDGKREADFISIVTWNRTADLAFEYLTKGKRALVEGRLQIRSYEAGGQKRWITEVIADRVEFVEAREKTSQNANAEARGSMESMGDAAYEDIPF